MPQADLSTSTTAPIPHPAIERAALRKQMIGAVNRMLEAVDLLIAELDGDAGDPDFEPSLGAIEAHSAYADQRETWRGLPPVREYGGKLIDVDDNEHDGGEPTEDGEHSLGVSEGEALIGRPGYGQDDLEPSLGSLDGHRDQRMWAAGGQEGVAHRDWDCEAQCEDEGWDSDTERDDADCG